ncbi:hypothetical protein PBT90_17630 [Algoriphagus halophytocola]|uniref:DUF5103 domain-containing protein n=1 Tax=Algoriphagus halophytocola TaxID=2991499 RepID=A0ABY6MCD7_9BACT|nr:MULTISPECIES: hypothetical protein [unclassified Algoriphagus]UZD21342.1 hypothetical protein OM944_11765 [Algoriphagus sp. TR-M5]WBL42554.1 hypothetical protein PBT90_17630 [Algoriphagus sp. TR-M9]
MRNFNSLLIALVLLAPLLLSSCQEDPFTPAPNPDPVEYVRLDDELNFHTIPKSGEIVNFQFDRIDGYQFKTIFLMADEDTLSQAEFTTSEYNTHDKLAASVSHQFDPEKNYYFLVEAVDYNTPNTRYTFELPAYNHVFAEAYTFQKIAEFDRMTDYDFSPSRDYLFVSDFSGNEFSIHRVDLKSQSIETYFSKSEIYGNLIRAASDHEFIFTGLPDESYDPEHPDRAFLRKMDIHTKTSSIIGDYSSSYGRVSRIIEGKMIVNATEPSIYTQKAIDIKSGENVSLGDIQNFVREYNYDQLILGDYFIEPSDLSLNPIPHTDEEAYFLYEDENGYLFYMETLPREEALSYSKIFVYKEGEKLFETKEVDLGYAQLFNKFKVTDGKFTYYKSHKSNHSYLIDGLYSVDLNTGEETLIHADFSPYYLAVYDFGDKGIITQRGWEFSFMEKIQP